MRIRVIQNCFLTEQLPYCDFEPYLNEVPESADERYLFLESDVLCRLVRDRWHADADYFGVVGPRWREKLEEAKQWGLPLKNQSLGKLTPDTLRSWVHENPQADFFSFGSFIQHPVYRNFGRCHRGLVEATSSLLSRLGISFDLRKTFPSPIYFYYFVCRSKILESYVRDLLSPLIELATHDRELRALCFKDSGYFRAIPESLRDRFAISYYPLHPFIGERLINVYVMLSGARVVSFDGLEQLAPNERRARALQRKLRTMNYQWIPKLRWLRSD